MKAVRVYEELTTALHRRKRYRFGPPGGTYDELGGEEDSSVGSFKNGSIS